MITSRCAVQSEDTGGGRPEPSAGPTPGPFLSAWENHDQPQFRQRVSADPEPQAAHTPSWGGGGHMDLGRHTLSSLKPPSFTRGIIRGLIPEAHLPKSVLAAAWLCLSLAQHKHCTQSGHLVYLFNLSCTHRRAHAHALTHVCTPL